MRKSLEELVFEALADGGGRDAHQATIFLSLQTFDSPGILPGFAGRRIACDSLARRLCRASTTNGAHHRRAVYLKARRLESAFHA
jgi:hypothetical protein